MESSLWGLESMFEGKQSFLLVCGDMILWETKVLLCEGCNFVRNQSFTGLQEHNFGHNGDRILTST